MIYLIDDSNIAALGAEYVFDPKYKDILTVVTYCDQLYSIEQELPDAVCIMVHTTFGESNIVREDMRDVTDDGDAIPLVIFSGGDNYVNYDGQSLIDHINKTVFYQRLKDFLDDYLHRGIVNLRILAGGKDYVKEDIKKNALNVLSIIGGKTGSISGSDMSILKASKGLRNIIDCSLPALKMSFDDLVARMENGSVGYENLVRNVNRIVISFSKYGKNIYSWK